MRGEQLRVFLAVARRRSFSRAAEALYLTQSAVSQQIGRLEHEYGVRLFARNGRRVDLTDAGAALLPYAEQVVRLLDEAARTLEELRSAVRGRLRLGASPTPATYLLPALLGAFVEEHPGVEVELAVEISARIARDVASGVLALGVVEGLTREPAVAARVLMEDELLLIASPRATFADEQIGLDALPGLRYIAREPGSLTRLLVEESLRARGITLRPVMELGHIEVIKRAVAAGLGVAFLPRCAVAAEIASGRLRVVRVADLDLRRPLYVLQREGERPAPVVAAFLGMLQQRATGLSCGEDVFS
jgi:DNA-binding transcriptional LysR family regulator